MPQALLKWVRMMKRICLLLLCLFFLAVCAGAESVPQYEAIANHDVNLRRKPVNGALISVIAEGDKVTVLEYGEDWCRVKYRSRTGYCMTKYLDRFRSLDAHAYPLPGHTPCVGFIRFEEETFLSGDAFEGITVKPQQVACVLRVSEEGYHLPVWRGETVIPLEKATPSSFVPWQEAISGDVIGGFTTYYGDQQGKGYAAERAGNIQIGCDRIQGQTVEAGESFSFNALCFPYTQENGYYYAPNISKEGFNYGGVISFAGAIYSTSGAPKWDSAPCPMLLFHGTSDGNVPYDKGSLMGIGMFGPATIVEGLEQLRVPYMFHSAEHKTHDMAVVPMIENHVEILEFIDRLVTAKQPIQRFMQVVDLTTPRGKRRFSVREYLTNNYGNDENDDKQ